jgi:Rrf2 family transcriptional regulator, nitric oxide-sensitive transcriptional repressor
VQLNIFTDYAFRVLIYAAAHGDQRCTAEELATAFEISRHHVVKVVNELQHLGYLETHRGRSGGFTLACPPGRIRLGDVVRRTEATLSLVECFDRTTNACPLTRACGLKGVLNEAFEAFFATLDRYTIADLVAEPRWAARLVALTPQPRTTSTRDGRLASAD